MIKNIGLTSLLLISSLHSPVAQADKKPVYTIGVVPQFEIRHTRKIWNPILNVIEKSTGIKLKLVGSPTISDFEHEVIAGKFDFAYMNPYHLLLAEKSQGYIPLVRDTGRQLFGILVVNKDSDITSVEQLNNKKVAFPSPNALGASLLVRADLARNFNINVKPVYVKTHSSVYLNVVVKQTMAGGGVQKTLKQQRDNIRGALRTIYQTPKVSPHPLASHPRVPNKVRELVKNTLLKLGNSKMGESLLLKIPIKKIGPAKLSDYTLLEKYNLQDFYVN